MFASSALLCITPYCTVRNVDMRQFVKAVGKVTRRVRLTKPHYSVRGTGCQAALAHDADCSTSAISRLESKGTDISIIRLRKIAQKLDRTAWQVLYEAEAGVELDDAMASILTRLAKADQEHRKLVLDNANSVLDTIERANSSKPSRAA